MTTAQLNKFIISFTPKKALPKKTFYFRASKNIVKKQKNIPANLSTSIDTIVYGI